MQILELECDPWRDQHFAESPYISEAHIPVDDADAFSLNPDYRWVYDQYLVSRSQQLECGPHDVEPSHYPVESVPVMELGTGSEACHVLYGADDHRRYSLPGTYWRLLSTGGVVSSDYAVVNAQAAWCRHAIEGQHFDCWTVEEGSRPRLEKYCTDWIGDHLAGYSGMVNIESSGGRITRVRLCFTDRWSDLYGRKWLHALCRLYRSRTWDLPADTGRTEGHSMALYGPADRRLEIRDSEVLKRCQSTMGISSVRLVPADPGAWGSSSRVPGKVLLAVINAFNIDVGLRVRETVARELGVAN